MSGRPHLDTRIDEAVALAYDAAIGAASWIDALAAADRALRAAGGHQRRVRALVAPHLVGALRIAARLEALGAQRHAARATLDELAIGVAFVEAGGRLVFANHRLRALAARGDGLRLVAGTLRAEDPETAAALHAFVAQALSRAQAADQVLTLARSSGRRALHALVAPISGAGRDRRTAAHALVLVVDPELHPSPPAELLRARYGWSEAETRVALRLAGGASLRSVAAVLNIRISTARNHLRHVLQKSGTHRQAELVSLLHARPPVLVRRGVEPRLDRPGSACRPDPPERSQEGAAPGPSCRTVERLTGEGA